MYEPTNQSRRGLKERGAETEAEHSATAVDRKQKACKPLEVLLSCLLPTLTVFVTCEPVTVEHPLLLPHASLILSVNKPKG